MNNLDEILAGLPEDRRKKIELEALLIIREELRCRIYEARDVLLEMLEKRRVVEASKWQEIYTPNISFYTSEDVGKTNKVLKLVEEATRALYQVDYKLKGYWTGELRDKDKEIMG